MRVIQESGAGMSQFDGYDLPEDGQPEQTDLAAQLAAERTKREAAERELATLQKRSAQPPPSADSGAPAPVADPYGAPPAGLLEKLQDRSRPWPEIEEELRLQHGFGGSAPRPSQVGLRGRS